MTATADGAVPCRRTPGAGRHAWPGPAGPGEVVVDSRVPWLADALTRHDVTVHPLDFDAVTPFAGGFRCSHHPLLRRARVRPPVVGATGAGNTASTPPLK